MALASNPALGQCPFFWVHRQEGLCQHLQIESQVQHEDLPQRPQLQKHLFRSNDGQNLAQRAPKESGHAHLAHSQQRPPRRVLATTNRSSLTMQGVRFQLRGICSTPSSQLSHGAQRLGSFQKSLDGVASAARAGDHLALRPVGRSGDGARGWPPRNPRLH